MSAVDAHVAAHGAVPVAVARLAFLSRGCSARPASADAPSQTVRWPAPDRVGRCCARCARSRAGCRSPSSDRRELPVSSKAPPSEKTLGTAEAAQLAREERRPAAVGDRHVDVGLIDVLVAGTVGVRRCAGPAGRSGWPLVGKLTLSSVSSRSSALTNGDSTSGVLRSVTPIVRVEAWGEVARCHARIAQALDGVAEPDLGRCWSRSCSARDGPHRFRETLKGETEYSKLGLTNQSEPGPRGW